ncbi:hypothetical protein PF004_g3942 [Phytophthora fragariae]|uniref:DDE Tnp4 domain-containing protein n=2 Tax=Phytophthora fragariae TaxID=53985 RepID=A0A6G0PKB8_9STRA|nr:hypothetical protein PF003_g27074 [Phytophthora fragariae]KAE9248253.1 hypothetical protein PF004_g3942 [Phytophthora fragariae]
MVRKLLYAIGPHLYGTFVSELVEKATMEKLVLSGKTFKYFPCARYATDVTFQQANRPVGNHNEAIAYFRVSTTCAKKLPGEVHLADEGPMRGTYPNEWAVLTEKGYQGLGADFRAIHPKRHQRMQPSSLEDMRQNDNISHDRVIVENYFGRLKTLWSVCADKWRWDEKSCDLFFRTCVALTNAHVRLRPLRAEEGDDYQRYVARLRAIGLSIKERQAAKRRAYRENRQARLAVSRRNHDTDLSESDGETQM